jgi:HlyD family secretion protein
MRSRRPLVIVAAVIVIAIALWLSAFRGHARNGALSAAGTVEATEARLGFPAAGLLQAVDAREGDAVASGAELAHLDRAEMLARLAQAQAQATAARALLDELERGARSEELAQARAAADAARERLNDAQRDLDRTRQLHDAGAVSQEALDKATLAQQLAVSQQTQAAEQLKLVTAGPRRERIEAQRAQLAQAEAAQQAIEASLTNLTLRAPFDGLVTVRHREPGEIVPAGSPVLSVMNRADRWVRIFVPETRIGAVRIDQPATITTDTFSRKTYEGRVVFIASEAEFTPKTVQTAAERVKLVYAVKVQITGDADFDLKPGMPADVRLELEGS